MLIVYLFVILLVLNLGAYGYAYYRYIYDPRQQAKSEIVRGRVPNQFLPAELQKHDEVAAGQLISRKRAPLKWQAEQEAIAEHFTKYPELKESWMAARAKEIGR